MNELKPCPFCGGEAGWGAIDNKHYIKCMTPCAIRPTTALYKFYDTKEEAIQVWNKRTTVKP